MKISVIQSALQTLGFLPPSHPVDGEWDSQTNAGYINAAQSGNLHPALWAQPSNVDQLPAAVRELYLADGCAPAAPTPPGPTAAELAAAKAKADKEEADKAAAALKAEADKAAAEASAAKVNIEAEVKADATVIEADSGTNAPDSNLDN
jgi:hypothetical protein